MKKLLVLLIAIVIFCLTATACGNKKDETTKIDSTSTIQSSSEKKTSSTVSTQASSNQTQVSNSVSTQASSNQTQVSSSVSTQAPSSQPQNNSSSNLQSSTASSVDPAPVPSVTLPTSGASLNANDVAVGTLATEKTYGNFTICSGNSQSVVVDEPAATSIKTYENLTFTRRIKLSKIDLGSKQSSIAFTLTKPATIYYLAMSSSSTANRKVCIINGSGQTVATSTNYAQLKGSVLVPESLTVNAAGTYYLGSADGGVNFYYVIIDSSSVGTAPVTPKIPDGGSSLNANSCTVGIINSQVKVGDFTLMAGNGIDATTNNPNQTIEIDTNKKSSGTYSFTQRIKLSGKMDPVTKIRSIKFTTTGPATITYCAMSSSSSDNTRKISIINENGETVATSTDGAQASNNEITPKILTVSADGTYYIGCLENSVNFYFITVN